MESTVNDFWRMVWEHKSRVLVMLCGLKEDGKVNQLLLSVALFRVMQMIRRAAISTGQQKWTHPQCMGGSRSSSHLKKSVMSL